MKPLTILILYKKPKCAAATDYHLDIWWLDLKQLVAVCQAVWLFIQTFYPLATSVVWCCCVSRF